jgi:hypothetical protein
LREDFQKASGVFQQDGLAVAGNFSVLNFQAPNREWKKVTNGRIEKAREMKIDLGRRVCEQYVEYR